MQEEEKEALKAFVKEAKVEAWRAEMKPKLEEAFQDLDTVILCEDEMVLPPTTPKDLVKEGGVFQDRGLQYQEKQEHLWVSQHQKWRGI